MIESEEPQKLIYRNYSDFSQKNATLQKAIMKCSQFTNKINKTKYSTNILNYKNNVIMWLVVKLNSRSK